MRLACVLLLLAFGEGETVKNVRLDTEISVDDLVETVVLQLNHDDVFDLIVKLEAACQDGDLLERLHEHFTMEFVKEGGQ